MDRERSIKGKVIPSLPGLSLFFSLRYRVLYLNEANRSGGDIIEMELEMGKVSTTRKTKTSGYISARTILFGLPFFSSARKSKEREKVKLAPRLRNFYVSVLVLSISDLALFLSLTLSTVYFFFKDESR